MADIDSLDKVRRIAEALEVNRIQNKVDPAG